ncbi:MAG: hypothetical protein P8182_15865, partial [Deltaproteobacteria bacterium]
PNLKGTWVGTGMSVRFQKGPEPDPNVHGMPKSGPQEVEFTVTVDKQDGFRFSGRKTSANHKEAIVGVIGFDNKTAYVVDHNGIEFWRIVSPDKVESVYLHTTKDDSVAARGVLVRKR